jgi:hypothetical protein
MDEAKRVFPEASTIDVFSRHAIRNYDLALEWYGRLFGCPPAFFPNDREAVWEIAEHRYLYIEILPVDAGHASSLFFVSDLDGVIAQIGRRGIIPSARETLGGGVRKVTFRDPDGNHIAFGGAPL